MTTFSTINFEFITFSLSFSALSLFPKDNLSNFFSSTEINSQEILFLSLSTKLIPNSQNSFLINKLLEKGSLDFQITDFMFNKAKGFHGPFKSSLLKNDDYLKISENIFFQTLLEILDKNRINTPNIRQKRKKTFIEKVELISHAKTNYYFLKKELSVEPKKFEHEWSHALVSYDEFICFTHNKNSFFLISLARD